MRRLSVLVLLVPVAVAFLALLPGALSQGMTRSERPLATPLALADFLAPRGAQVRRGAELYDLHCSACHGDTGLGFTEAKLAFPEDDRSCVRCHRRDNPPQMPLSQMAYNFAFSIGEAPALAGEDQQLARFGSGLALYRYVQATMPRPFPATLEDADYLAITAFLLELNGTALGGTELTADNAAGLALGGD